MVEIPCRPDLSHYDMQCVLDNVTYTLEFRWNTRAGAWYLDLRAEDGTPIYTSLKVVVGFPLGARCASDDRLPGRLIAFDTTNRDANPGITDLGDRVKLLYYPAAELADADD